MIWYAVICGYGTEHHIDVSTKVWYAGKDLVLTGTQHVDTILVWVTRYQTSARGVVDGYVHLDM